MVDPYMQHVPSYLHVLRDTSLCVAIYNQKHAARTDGDKAVRICGNASMLIGDCFYTNMHNRVECKYNAVM
jgi:hypothetical protein